jgi:hypothetical protein
MLDSFTATENYARFKCVNNHIFTAIINNVLRGRGCKKCHFENRTYDEFMINEKLKERGLRIVGNYINSQTKILFECSLNHTWETKPNNVLNGQGCPYCNPAGFNRNNAGWTYVLLFENCIKYGLTTHLKKRLRTHKTSGNYEIKHTRLYQNGDDAWEWEKRIKNSLGGKFMSKENFPTGHTETLPATFLEIVLNEYCRK